ncbi:hypothetical protein LCGC14_1302190 [marine sediment metagenome]|uniref:Uncharacterized protein n=1 Tax=marine sediment metagenome TaxID=412755 RepID=A0A0F9KPM2_9ZZZZ
MAKIILWEQADGSISYGVAVPGKEIRMVEQFEKSQSGLKRLPDRDAAELPDKEYRNAWRANPDGTIRIDAQIKQQIINERARPSIEERLAALEAKQTR